MLKLTRIKNLIRLRYRHLPPFLKEEILVSTAKRLPHHASGRTLDAGRLVRFAAVELPNLISVQKESFDALCGFLAESPLEFATENKALGFMQVVTFAPSPGDPAN